MTKTYTVTIFHNEGPEAFMEFDSKSALLREAGSYAFHAEAVATLLNDVFRTFNIGDPRQDENARKYREGQNRSLSVGDVVLVDEHGGPVSVHSVASLGFNEEDAEDVNEASTFTTKAEEIDLLRTKDFGSKAANERARMLADDEERRLNG